MATDTEPTTIEVLSDLAPDGRTYVTTVQLNGDTARTLDRNQGDAWVRTVLAAAVQAEHDALIMQHLIRAVGSTLEEAALVVSQLRADRPALDHDATAPMRLTPGINADCEPFLAVHINGTQVGQWDPADARDHAIGVIEVITSVDLDAAYHRFLVAQMGVTPENARTVIAELAELHDAQRGES